MPLPSLLVLLAWLLLATGAAACEAPQALAAKRAEILRLTNTERVSAGLPKLNRSNALDKMAQDHACDNANQRQISHHGSDGSDLRSRFRRVGYAFRAGNENVGNYPTAAKMFAAWWKSKGHHDNILAPNITEIGVGAAIGADNKTYWVTVGGAKR